MQGMAVWGASADSGPQKATGGGVTHSGVGGVVQAFRGRASGGGVTIPGGGGQGWAAPLEGGRQGLQVSWLLAAGSTTPRTLPHCAAQQLIRGSGVEVEQEGDDVGDLAVRKALALPSRV